MAKFQPMCNIIGRKIFLLLMKAHERTVPIITTEILPDNIVIAL